MSNIGAVRTNVPVDTHLDTPSTAPTSGAAATAAPIALTAGGLKGKAGLADVAAGTATMGVGARGEGAKAIQEGLKKLGFLAGAADGIFGRGTSSAVAQFQRASGLTPSGEVDQATLGALDKKLAAASAPRSLFAEGGKAALNQKMQGHFDAIDKTGVGLYYGDHSSYKSMKPAEREAWIAANKTAGTNPPAPKQSSCIGWAMENVKAAYVAAGKEARWSQIERIVSSQGMKGTDLAKELQKDGWESVYWNPDAKNPDDGNGEHSFSASQVAKGKPYYGIKVDHQVIDYRPSGLAKPGKQPTTQNLEGIKKLEQAPFFFGLAKGGMHTFVGQQGRVNEFHWDRNPDQKDAIEERPLTEFPWNSGVIMLPPGTWPK